jgi:hypothetical protein
MEVEVTDKKIPLSDIADWYDVRDFILQAHEDPLSLAKAFELARSCRHEDALWLLSLFPPHDIPANLKEFRKGLEPHLWPNGEPRAIYFEAMLTSPRSVPLLLQAAEMGYSLAEAATLPGEEDDDDEDDLIEKVVDLKDRDLLAWLIRRLVKPNTLYPAQVRRHRLQQGTRLLRQAILLGHVMSYYSYGVGVLNSLQGRWSKDLHWWCRTLDMIALRPTYAVHRAHILSIILSEARVQRSPRQDPRRLFELGRLIHRHLPVDERPPSGATAEGVQEALDVYGKACGRARAAVGCWTMVARRLGVVRDVRRIIGEMLWAEQDRWASADDDGWGWPCAIM